MQRARAVDAFVIWTLTIVLAGAFLLAGVPKLIGASPVAFQAAVMEGFPPWIRIVIGVIETVCALALFVPATATIAALGLALLVIPAVATQWMSRQPGVWIPLVVLALLLLLVWRRNAEQVSDGYHDFAGAPHPVLREGLIAGLIGALVIAAWFGALDLAGGRPFFTPATLGRGLLSVFGPIAPDQGTATFVLVYTIFHVVAFAVVGLALSLIVALARREPSILLGFAILFVVIEVGFYGFVGLLDVATALGRNAWLHIMVGNLLAAAAMGIYFWRRHAEIRYELHHAFDVPERTADGREGENGAEPVAAPPVVPGVSPPPPKSPSPFHR